MGKGRKKMLHCVYSSFDTCFNECRVFDNGLVDEVRINSECRSKERPSVLILHTGVLNFIAQKL